LKVSGLGGVPTYITAHAEVKITLGPRVVYVVRLWVANIGEEVDVLLGMNFMFSAEVRLSTREGLVMLPDEDTILMYGGPDRSHMGLDLPVRPTETLYLRPGDSTVVRIRYGQSNPQREVIWAGRGVPHANPWAACAVLGQMYDGVIQPVRFTGRVLNESEIRYHVAEKEVVAVLRVLEQFRPLICDSELPL